MTSRIVGQLKVISLALLLLTLWTFLGADRPEVLHARPLATNVSGTISTNTTWTPAGNPYVLTANVEIAAGVTLTIQPGVIVNNGAAATDPPSAILASGTLQAVGSAASPITFNGVEIGGGASSTESPYTIVVQFARLNGGRFHPAGMAEYGSFILRDSILANTIPQHSYPDNNSLYGWYPVTDSYVERNIFYNSYGINAGTSDDVKVYVRNNVFVGWKGTYAVENWAAYNTSGMVVENNSFLSTDRIAVSLPAGYDSSQLSAINNYWGTTDPTVIAQMIRDKKVELGSAGIIPFEPFLTTPPTDLLEWVVAEPSGYNFQAVAGAGNTQPQPLTIISSVPWTASASQSWIGLSQTTGNGLQTIGIFIKPQALTAGVQNGKVVITAGSTTTEFSVKVTVQSVASFTNVSGEITESTIWSLAGSPYRLTGDLTIAEGVALIIEPGVVVEGNGNGWAVSGKLLALGTDESPITFEDVKLNGADTHLTPYWIEISHAIFEGGSLSSPTYGTLQLLDSTINGWEKELYLWYPVSDVHIERNIFTSSHGITAGVSDGVKVYVRNNVFDRQRTNYAVEVWATYGTSRVIVEHNTFLSTDRAAVRLKPGYSSSKLSARDNYWHTTDIATIKNMIFDQNDDPTANDLIPYKPFLSGPHPATPDIADMPPDDAGGLNVVRGAIVEDTTWTLANSPYILTDKVQVGATLTIEPGVVVEGDWFELEVFGVLMAVGTAEKPIFLEKLEIIGGPNDPDESFEIVVQHARLDKGRFYPPTGNGIYGSFILRDSILANTVPQHSYPDNNSIYGWYPVADSYIERNIFYNGYGINAGLSEDVKVYVRNNVFVGWKGSYAVENWAAYNTSGMVVENNSFLSTDRVAVSLPKGYDGAKLSAVNNYWGTTDPSVIAQMIDAENDGEVGAAAVIPFEPFLTSPDANTPVVPDPILPVDPDDLDDPDDPSVPDDPDDPDDPEDPEDPEDPSNLFMPTLKKQ